MSKYEIVKLNHKDYGKCSNIWNMEKNTDRTKEWYEQIKDGSREVYIYVVDGVFIGEAGFYHNKKDSMYYIPNNRIYLSRMIVNEKYRNKGIGGILLDFMCQLAKDRGYIEISLGVDVINTAARHLYEKKGFTEVVYHGTDQWGEYYKLVKSL